MTSLNYFFPVPVPGLNGQSLSVTTTNQAMTAYTPSQNVKLVEINVRTDAVYVTFDGQTPSSTVGQVLPANTREMWNVGKFNAARFSIVTGTAFIYAAPHTV